MRIRTTGDSEWRLGLYDDVGDLLDENTRSGAIDGACLFTRQMLPALERAVEHEDMTEVEYEIETGVKSANGGRMWYDS
jgi:hypothetical protein